MKRLTTILEAAADLQHRRRSASDLVEECLLGIERFEPRVHAWVMIDEAGARQTARRLDEELKQGDYRGPLHGIPIGIKALSAHRFSQLRQAGRNCPGQRHFEGLSRSLRLQCFQA